jgi:hypothetical protein
MYSWLNGVAPATMFPSLFQHSKRKGRTVVEAMANENWIGDLMHNLTTGLLIEYALPWEPFDASHYDQHDQEEDSIIWSLKGDGEYSVKFAYSVQFEGSVQSTFPSRVWKVWALLRCKFFVWLLLQNHVWMADLLLMKEWPNKYFCQLCQRNLETTHHLLVECQFSQEIWTEVCNWSTWSMFDPDSWPQ